MYDKHVNVDDHGHVFIGKGKKASICEAKERMLEI